MAVTTTRWGARPQSLFTKRVHGGCKAEVGWQGDSRGQLRLVELYCFINCLDTLSSGSLEESITGKRLLPSLR